jgi:phosphohistidine phosphatase
LRIWLVRHGDADAEIPEGLGDEARPLTTKARHVVEAHFHALADRLANPAVIFSSPLVRAVQTAQILAMVLRYEGPMRIHRVLLPDMPVGALEGLIQEHLGQNLILVGHQPSMGALASHLLGLQSSFPKQVSPGTVIGLEREGEESSHPARFSFYAPPGQPLLETIEP